MAATVESLPKTGRLEVDIKVTADVNISAFAARQKVRSFVLSACYSFRVITAATSSISVQAAIKPSREQSCGAVAKAGSFK